MHDWDKKSGPDILSHTFKASFSPVPIEAGVAPERQASRPMATPEVNETEVDSELKLRAWIE